MRSSLSSKLVGPAFFLMAAFATQPVATASPQKPLASGEAQRLQVLMKNAGEIFAVAEHLEKSGGSPSPIAGTIQDGECEKKLSLPEDNPPLVAGDTQVPTFTFDIGGPKCPVRYHVELHGQQVGSDQQAFHADYKLTYEAVTDQARKAADVDQSIYTGVIDAAVVKSADGFPHMNMSGSFGGSGHSQKEGAFNNQNTFGLALTIGGPGGMLDFHGTSVETLDFGFHDITAKLESQTGFGANEPSYYKLNEKEISADEYAKYRKDFNLPGLSTQDPGGDSSTSAPLKCQVDLYSATALTPARASQALAAHRAIVAPALFSMPVEVTQKITISLNGRDLMVDTQASSAVTEIKLSLCPAGRTDSCTSISRAFLPDEDQAYADALGDLTAVIGCRP